MALREYRDASLGSPPEGELDELEARVGEAGARFEELLAAASGRPSGDIFFDWATEPDEGDPAAAEDVPPLPKLGWYLVGFHVVEGEEGVPDRQVGPGVTLDQLNAAISAEVQALIHLLVESGVSLDQAAECPLGSGPDGLELFLEAIGEPAPDLG